MRDCLHPHDLLPLLEKQFAAPKLSPTDRIANISGGATSAMSLKQLSDWCAGRFGPREVATDGKPRLFDIPWIVLDHSKAAKIWNWKPTLPTSDILEEIARHAESHPGWLELSATL